MGRRVLRPWIAWPATAFLAGFAAMPAARAGIGELVQAVASSEVTFLRAESDVPFMPIAWAKHSHYGSAEFTSLAGADPGPFSQSEWNVGMLAPVHAGRRDLVLLGVDVGHNRFRFDQTPAANGSVLAITPAAGWIRQLDEDDQIVAFVAPGFASALGDTADWALYSYAGLMGTRRVSDRLLWVYGAVHEYSAGSQFLYPYLGFQWLPNRNWSVALVVPWPTVSWAPNKKVFFSVGVVPGGASWHYREDGRRLSASFGSWNLMAGAGVNVYGKFWLQGQVGYAGLHGLQIDEQGGASIDVRASNQPVYSLNLQFRP